ncbi:hypothetical protein ASE68_03365 [Agromyces sp. Leaf222]|nr:hypothetical protein ASE68_03365 [Agromyces sp. Leaf222]
MRSPARADDRLPYRARSIERPVRVPPPSRPIAVANTMHWRFSWFEKERRVCGEQADGSRARRARCWRPEAWR